MDEHPVPLPCNTTGKFIASSHVHVCAVLVVYVDKIAALDDEALDYTMEGRPLVSNWISVSVHFFSYAELSKVLCSSGDNICKQFHFYSSHCGA